MCRDWIMIFPISICHTTPRFHVVIHLNTCFPADNSVHRNQGSYKVESFGQSAENTSIKHTADDPGTDHVGFQIDP